MCKENGEISMNIQENVQNIQKAARRYGVKLSEGSWHDLGIYRRKRRKALPGAL